jgi:GMP synthase-like glutamine amidotransferase
MLVIMGGPMGANDDNLYSWLKAEKAFIAQAIKNNKKVLGICLGSQLISSVLGAKVYPNKFKEVGFFPINKKSTHSIVNGFPDSIMAFHWHGDTYDLPEGAELLFSSEGCVNQAFIYGNNVLALQFHFEITEKLIDTWFSGNEKQEQGKYIQSKEEIFKGKAFIPTCNILLSGILDKFIDI